MNRLGLRERAAAPAGLAALGLAAAGGSLLTVAVAVWGVRSERLAWEVAVHDLLGVIAPALAVAAVAAGALGAAAAVAARAWGGLAAAGVAVLLGGAVLVAGVAWRAEQARTALAEPAVHDVATDWREPLMPTAALLRARGADALPIEAAPALGEGPRAGFLGRPVAEVNASTCPQAAPLVLAQAPVAAYDRLRAAAREAGLRLVTDARGAGVLEAQARAPLAYGGHADVLARVRAEGEGARIDLRSISRHGQVDGGTNCRRIAALRRAILAG